MGLIINRFQGNGIVLSGGGGNRIEGNRLGTNAAGTTALGNQSGVLISDSANNTVGGTTPASRNLISGNTQYGVEIAGPGARGNLVVGNYIGTDLEAHEAPRSLDAGILRVVAVVLRRVGAEERDQHQHGEQAAHETDSVKDGRPSGMAARSTADHRVKGNRHTFSTEGEFIRTRFFRLNHEPIVTARGNASTLRLVCRSHLTHFPMTAVPTAAQDAIAAARRVLPRRLRAAFAASRMDRAAVRRKSQYRAACRRATGSMRRR
jgi:hypothetical protein